MTSASETCSSHANQLLLLAGKTSLMKLPMRGHGGAPALEILGWQTGMAMFIIRTASCPIAEGGGDVLVP